MTVANLVEILNQAEQSKRVTIPNNNLPTDDSLVAWEKDIDKITVSPDGETYHIS